MQKKKQTGISTVLRQQSALNTGRRKKIHGRRQKVMKQSGKFMIPFIAMLIFLAISALTGQSSATICSDGTGDPPFLESGVSPNLLLLIDNSASMYDPAYVNATEASYCYANDYDPTKAYAGYFEPNGAYYYDLTNDEFIPTTEALAKTECSGAIGTKYTGFTDPNVGEMCLTIDTGIVKAFAARGNLLNWLTASKLDVEKEILTGGKYDSANQQLVLESRGCYGQTYIKEVTLDNGFFATFGIRPPTDTEKTSDASHNGSISNTRIEIYDVDTDGFKFAECETALNDWLTDVNLGTTKKDTKACLEATGNTLTSTQPAFNHITQECWYFNKHGSWQPGNDYRNMMPQCENSYDLEGLNPPILAADIPAGYKPPEDLEKTNICYGKHGTTEGYVGRCWETFYSSGGETCSTVACNVGDPQPNTDYTYRCSGGIWTFCNGNFNSIHNTCNGSPGTWDNYEDCVMDPGGVVEKIVWTDDDSDDGGTCIDEMMQKFCLNMVSTPEVVDPSDPTSDVSGATGEAWAVPGLIMDMALNSQLGNPLETSVGRIQQTSSPTGLIDEFKDDLRIGAMVFNSGPYAECTPVEEPAGSGRYIASLYDCLLDKGTAITASSSPDPAQRDGAKVITYIDQGDDHTTDLTKALNDVEADAWTPTAEGLYNALGYYTQDNVNNLRLNLADFIWDHDYSSYSAWTDNTLYMPGDIVYDGSTNKLYFTRNGGMSDDGAGSGLPDDIGVTWIPYDPVIAHCQGNNILIISDGATTADVATAVSSFITTAGNNDGDAEDTPYECLGTSGEHTLYGSTLMDDIISYGSNNGASIYPAGRTQIDSSDKQPVDTYIVVAGDLQDPDANVDSECHPEDLLTEAANKSGTTLKEASDPGDLEEDLRATFNEIRGGAASGSAASVISSSRGGEGAIYQAIFWPRITLPSGDALRWTGEVHGLFIDAYGYMYEDSDGNRTLDPNSDERVIIYYDESDGATMACNGDLNDAGDSCIGTAKDLEDVHFLWSVSEWLADLSDPLNNRASYISTAKQRNIYTWNDLDNDGVVDNSEFMDFEPTVDWAGLGTAAGRGSVPLDFGKSTDAEVDRIVSWVRGLDDTADATLRDRQIGFDFDKDGTSETVTWRLGDVIHSTPVAVTVPSEGYHQLYRDSSYANFAAAYKDRRHMVYFGANDGMLHAVNGGFYNEAANRFCRTSGCTDEGATPTSSPELGAELWAYVPYNLLPHLDCLTDPDYGGSGEGHKYFVDLRPRIFDVQIFADDATHPDGWGTILVAGMRFGGHPVDMSTVDGDADGVADASADNRVLKSSYMIFDITDPENPPELLAEMTDTGSQAEMGYATNIVTVVPMKDSTTTNWYLVFGSGPTDMNGRSTQQAKLAVVDLKKLVNSVAFRVPNSAPTTPNQIGVFQLPDANSFISDPITVDFDLANEYKADAVYFGTISGNWGSWGGKMYRLVTSDASNPATATVPSDWSTLLAAPKTNPMTLFDAGLPITASPTVGTDGRNYWVYFGTGRFFDKYDKFTASGSNVAQAFFGIKEPMSFSGTTVNCEGSFLWDTVEYSGTYNTTPGQQGLLYVDYIEIENASIASNSDLVCENENNPDPNINSDPNCTATKNTIDTNFNGDGTATFDELRDYIAGTGSGCDSTNDTFGKDGWYRHFDAARERNLGQATLLGGLLTYTSYQPYDDICLPEGLGFLYGVYFQTGTAWHKPVFGPPDDLNGSIVNERVDLGRGMATTPNLHVGKQEGGKAFVQTSTGAIVEIPQPNLPLKNYKTGLVNWATP